MRGNHNKDFLQLFQPNSFQVSHPQPYTVRHEVKCLSGDIKKNLKKREFYREMEIENHKYEKYLWHMSDSYKGANIYEIDYIFCTYNYTLVRNQLQEKDDIYLITWLNLFAEEMTGMCADD